MDCFCYLREGNPFLLVAATTAFTSNDDGDFDDHDGGDDDDGAGGHVRGAFAVKIENSHKDFHS